MSLQRDLYGLRPTSIKVPRMGMRARTAGPSAPFAALRSLRMTGLFCMKSRRKTPTRYLEMKEPIGTVDESESYQGNEDFSDGADSKRPPALLAQVTKVSAKADSGEGQQESPAR